MLVTGTLLVAGRLPAALRLGGMAALRLGLPLALPSAGRLAAPRLAAVLAGDPGWRRCWKAGGLLEAPPSLGKLLAAVLAGDRLDVLEVHHRWRRWLAACSGRSPPLAALAAPAALAGVTGNSPWLPRWGLLSRWH